MGRANPDRVPAYGQRKEGELWIGEIVFTYRAGVIEETLVLSYPIPPGDIFEVKEEESCGAQHIIMTKKVTFYIYIGDAQWHTAFLFCFFFFLRRVRRACNRFEHTGSTIGW